MTQRSRPICALVVLIACSATHSALAQQAAAVSGTTRDQTGAALDGVVISLADAGAAAAGTPGLVLMSVRSTAAGTFELSGLAPGSYRLRASLD